MEERLENKIIEMRTEKLNGAADKKESKPKRKGRKRKLVKRLIWMGAFALVAGILLWSVYGKVRADYQITYDPYTATTGSISNSLSFTGSMQLIDSASYTADADAKVREIYVSEGDQLKEGDRLIRLSNGTTYEAEFDGKVSSIDVEKNDEVKAGDSLMTVADFDHMQVSIRIGESNIAQVEAGQNCKVTVSSVNASFDSVIGKINYATYSGNNVAYYSATVDVDTSEAENVWPGMQATVTIPLEEANNVTVLKMDALSTARDNTSYVYKENESGEMEEVTVTVGVSNGNYVEIKDGVVSGETVYKIAEKEEEASGISGLLSGLFTTRQVNQPTRSSGGNGNMPDMGGGNMPDMGGMPGGSGSSGSRPGNSNGGSRGN